MTPLTDSQIDVILKALYMFGVRSPSTLIIGLPSMPGAIAPKMEDNAWYIFPTQTRPFDEWVEGHLIPFLEQWTEHRWDEVSSRPFPPKAQVICQLVKFPCQWEEMEPVLALVGGGRIKAEQSKQFFDALAAAGEDKRQRHAIIENMRTTLRPSDDQEFLDSREG